MDIRAERVLILPSGGGLRPWEGTKVGVTLVTEDPRLVRATAIPTTEFSRKATTSVLGTHSKLKKDVNFNGTNRRSPLESTKVSKNKLKMGSKQSGKTCRKYAIEPEQKQKGDPNLPDYRSTPRLCLSPPTTTVLTSKLSERSLNVYENKWSA
jgi:hypothetical protein